MGLCKFAFKALIHPD